MTEPEKTCCGPGYASPAHAIKAAREKLLYTVAIYTGTGVEKPDYLVTIDADPDSPTYSQVIARLEMPNLGDELHHIGWNACSSCHDDHTKKRKYLIVPGVRSTRIHIIDTGTDPRNPTLFKVIEGDEIKAKTNLSGPHTVHCLGSDIIISMLGDAQGNAPGGFLHLDENFEIVGRWEKDITGMNFNYDFWYQPRHNMMISSEWAAPNTFMPGFDLDDVAAGKYGHSVHFWDFANKSIIESVDLGAEGMIPLEIRCHHDPDSSHGFVAATLSSNIFHFHKRSQPPAAENRSQPPAAENRSQPPAAEKGSRFEIAKVIDIPTIDVEGFPVPMPSLITDILVSMDDRYLYLANWLHGDVRQYDIRDPANPVLTGQVWLGGMLGKAPEVHGRPVDGAPQMLQLSLDGKRLYVTTSLFSTWDNQFYPNMKTTGGCMVMIECDPEKGGMQLDSRFFIDFGKEPHGPSRAHETRYPGGDCTSDIWL